MHNADSEFDRWPAADWPSRGLRGGEGGGRSISSSLETQHTHTDTHTHTHTHTHVQADRCRWTAAGLSDHIDSLPLSLFAGEDELLQSVGFSPTEPSEPPKRPKPSERSEPSEPSEALEPSEPSEPFHGRRRLWEQNVPSALNIIELKASTCPLAAEQQVFQLNQ